MSHALYSNAHLRHWYRNITINFRKVLHIGRQSEISSSIVELATIGARSYKQVLFSHISFVLFKIYLRYFLNLHVPSPFRSTVVSWVYTYGYIDFSSPEKVSYRRNIICDCARCMNVHVLSAQYIKSDAAFRSD